ncbi:MAG: GGDEF domain-containing protein, partial [Pseudomonadota bacterium]
KKQNRVLALTDPLTKLLNRRALQDFSEALSDDKEPVRLLLIDIDHFKSINDTYGHDMGDEVLVLVANTVNSFSGNNVSAARLGGEEFALLGTNADLPAATALQLLAAVREVDMPFDGQVTVSVGIAEGKLSDADGWQRLYTEADDALYEAKETGRNRACHVSDIDTQPKRRRMEDSKDITKAA